MITLSIDDFMNAVKAQVEWVAEHYDELARDRGVEYADAHLEDGIASSELVVNVALNLDATMPLQDMIVHASWRVACLWLDVRNGVQTVDSHMAKNSDDPGDDDLAAWLTSMGKDNLN